MNKCTNTAKEFLLHNKKMQKYEKKIQFGKKYASPANEFLLHPVEAIRKLKNNNFENVQIQLMSIYYTCKR